MSKDTTTKYSIILPVRNGGEYVKECVKSILSQTVADFEFIILDNCSTDGTLEWLNSILDERIIIYSSEVPLSIEDSWSRIKTIPKKEYMTIIGHDDFLHANYLSEMRELIKKHPSASLFQTHFNYVDQHGAITRPCLPMDEIQTSSEFLACQMNNTIDSTGTGYMMLSRDFEDMGGMPVKYPNLIFSDYELWIRLARKGYKATSPHCCFSYREHLSVSRLTGGMLYQQAFGEYIAFVSSLKDDPGFNLIIQRYGKRMLLNFCESLSHRLLRTPRSERAIHVKDLVTMFKGYARVLIPDQSFEPLKVARIRYSVYLDMSVVGRVCFRIYRAIRY